MADRPPEKPFHYDLDRRLAAGGMGEVFLARDKTTGPAITASRALVFGLLAAVLGSVLLVAFSMVLLRVTVIGVNSVLDVSNLERPGRAVWIAYFVDAALFGLIGLVLWRRAAARVS
jgi:hypothetical protein